MSKETKNINSVRKKTASSFKMEWLHFIVETATPISHKLINVQLKDIFLYNSDSGIKCKYCVDAKSSGDFVSGKKWDNVWKLDFLKRHLVSKLHVDAVGKLRRQNSSLPATGLLRLLKESPQEKERKRSKPDVIKALIDNVLLAIKMNNSLNSVLDINDHLSKYINLPDSWRSKNYAFEFLDIINDIILRDQIENISSADFHTLAVDESTDITINKYLILYFKFRPKNSTAYITVFGGIIRLQGCDAVSIVLAIKKFYSEHNLELRKMIMFTSDGAPVMLGKVNGVAAQLKKEVPYLIEQHCVAHREDLGICDSWKEVKLMRDIETLLRTIFTIFCRSSVKKEKLQEIARVSEMESVSFKSLNEVRWLSRHFAVQAVIKNYDTLLKYFEDEKDNDPISSYCYKNLIKFEYRIALEALNEILEELAALCRIFQRRNLTPLDALHFARAKLNKLRQQYLGNNVIWSSNVLSLFNKAHEENCQINENSFLTFIKLLCNHLDERFPPNEVKEWSAFDLSLLSDCDFNFGTEEIEVLCLKYQHVLANRSIIIKQYIDFKFSIKEKIDHKVISNFEDMVKFSLENDQFSDLARLMDIGGTFLASSVDCERGFSLMNSIKTKLRNRLGESHLEMIMRVKSFQSDGGIIDLDKVYNNWVASKDRREKI